MSPRRKQTRRKPAEDVPRIRLATKTARKTFYDPARSRSDRVSTGDNLPYRRYKPARKMYFDPESNRVVTHYPKANFHKKPKLVHACQVKATISDDGDNSSVLSASFDIHDLNEKEEEAAEAERAGQQRRPFPEP